MVHATRTSQRRPPSSNRTCRFPTSGLPKGRRSKACVERAWQGPFAPRALPRFNATMSPSDSRSSRHAVMGSRASLTLGLCAKRHSNGSLRFLAILSASAVPSHPGEPGRCRRSLLHGR
jgi:hypothetical protein